MPQPINIPRQLGPAAAQPRLRRRLGETAYPSRSSPNAASYDSNTAPPLTIAMVDGKDADSLLTVPEACHRLRISRWTLYRLIREDQLQTVKIGTARRVPVAALHQLISELQTQGATSYEAP